MHRRTFLIVATGMLAAACTTSEEANQGVDGTGGTGGTTDTIDTGNLNGTTTYDSGPAPTIDWVRQAYGDTVLFEFDSAVVNPSAEAVVREWAGWMGQFPQVSVTIQGHCDERGTREYNLALGDRRANAVRNVLMAMGASPNRIGTVSYGKERPVVEGHTEAAWSKNRRAVLTIV